MLKKSPCRRLFALLACALLAHFLLALTLPPVLATLVVLLLTGWLPGLLLVEALVGQSEAPPTLAEHLLYALASGYGIIVLVMLGLSYLPGPIATWQTYLAFDLTLLILALCVWYRTRQSPYPATPYTLRPTPYAQITDNWPLLTSLACLLLIGGYLRFANLGYAEFHGDEARAVLRAAGVIQGYEAVLFLHKKGPAEVLLPAVVFSLSGRLDEASARLPFAIANLAALLAVFVLGRHLLGTAAGWAATFLLAFDGYLIAFARFVQYQSLVLLTSALMVLLVYRLVQRPTALANYAVLAAILAATGLWGHYDAAAVAPPLLFLLGVLGWQQRLRWRRLAWAAWLALGVGGALLAFFYLPFVLHPNFQATSSYLEGRMAGNEHFPYNNLTDFFRRSSVYSAGYYVILLIGLITLALGLAYQRGFAHPWRKGLGVLPFLLVAIPFWRADWLRIGDTDFTAVAFALALLLVWLAPRLRGEERTLWLWFGLLLLLALFGLATPRTHVYIFLLPWALLAGGVLAQGWHWLHSQIGQRFARVAGGTTLTLLTFVFGFYAHQLFVANRVEVLRTWAANRPAGYWAPSAAEQVDSLYGFPLTNGWKTIGALYARGVLQGDYETNQRYAWIPDWYTRGQHRCAATAQWYFAVDGLEPWAEDSRAIEDRLESQGFQRWGVVEVNAAPRLQIYKQVGEEAVAPPLQTFRLDDYAPMFDRLAHPDLRLGYPVIETGATHKLHVNFANQIWLEGYDITYNEPLESGDSFRLTLYWQAQRRIEQNYKVFNQAYNDDGVKAAQKDGYPVCDREPTPTWTPGQRITDVYDLTVAADTPAGVYRVYTGLYLESSGERLAVLDAAGNALDNQVHIADIQVDSD